MIALLAALLIYVFISVVTASVLVHAQYELDTYSPSPVQRAVIFTLVPVILVVGLWEGENLLEIIEELFSLIVYGKPLDDTDY